MPPSSASPTASPAPFSASAFFKEHPFVTVGGVWGTVLGGTVAFLWRRQIPMQLKIIQARIVAQGTLLAVCASAAAIHFFHDDGSEHPTVAVQDLRVAKGYARFDPVAVKSGVDLPLAAPVAVVDSVLK